MINLYNSVPLLFPTPFTRSSGLVHPNIHQISASFSVIRTGLQALIVYTRPTDSSHLMADS